MNHNDHESPDLFPGHEAKRDHEVMHDHGGMPSRAGMHDQGGMAGHAGMHDRHAGHDPAMFRRRFWVCLVLTIPVVLTSHMVMEWLGYHLSFPGVTWVGPILGSVVFFWGGWPSWWGDGGKCALGCPG